MARGLLADGRPDDVARMVEPLLEPLPARVRPGGEHAGQLLLRCLLARVLLLSHGDARRVLEMLGPFEPLVNRPSFDANVRAEVALRLGWAHAWQDAHTYDDARALTLLDKAERLFRETLNAGGRCWALLGQAQAYFTIDEYPLMLQALDEATALQETLQDVQATLWIHDLSVTGARFRGRYAQAQAHLDAFSATAQKHDDAMARGRALAHQAALDFDLGRSPAHIIEQAEAAETLLSNAVVKASYPLSEAYRTHIRALIRSGDLAEADRLIDRAMDTAGDVPGTAEQLLKQRARLMMMRGEDDAARDLLDRILARMRRLQRRLPASTVALLRSRLLERQGQPERALEWADRALREARETGHGGRQLEALLHRARLCAGQGRLEEAREDLRRSERLGAYFSVLPFAAMRFATLGRLAQAEGDPESARAHFAQALSAYSLIGAAYRTAEMQLALARLGRGEAPAQTRPLLEAALRTFTRLRARPELEAARALGDTRPPEGAGMPETLEASIGASLARASLSVALVAEAWLQAAERLLPGRWLCIYRHREGRVWERVHEHGTPPGTLAFPDPGTAVSRAGGIRWVRLREPPGPAFFFGVAVPEGDPAWEAAEARLRPWLPVATLALDHALLRARRLTAAPAPEEETPDVPIPGFIHAGPAMRRVVRQVRRIRAGHSPVLITGESGTGKELIARAVHATSERKQAPFLAFNCSTVPPERFESHLFGHEKGAFTGAVRAHPGVIREADRGTLFLDEIGDLPLRVQPKLLRFLQEGEVFPLAAKRPVRVNVRVIAATTRDLEALIRAGRFREDLYYRLNVIPLRVPPLRERREEIPLLVRHFLTALRPPGAPPASITRDALDVLLRYDWPGNVRQLRNEIERALVYAGSEPAPMIDYDDLSPAILEAAEQAPRPAPNAAHDRILSPDYHLDDLLADTEKALIERVLSETGGQVSAAAGMLGLTRQGLYKKMKRLGIDAARRRRREPAAPPDALFHLN